MRYFRALSLSFVVLVDVRAVACGWCVRADAAAVVLRRQAAVYTGYSTTNRDVEEEITAIAGLCVGVRGTGLCRMLVSCRVAVR